MSENINAEDMITSFWEDVEKSLLAIDKGEELNIVSLESQAVKICNAISSLPAEEAREYKPKLEEIIQKLGAVQDKLHLIKDETESDINNINRFNEARYAYSEAGSLKSAIDQD